MTRTSFKVQRIIASVLLIAAFVVMASVFSPKRSTANEDIGKARGGASNSTNPHEGLRSLGTLHDVRYIVHIYATDVGPRFTILERDTDRELGALLSPEQVQRAFPELNLPQLDFSVPTNGELRMPQALMLAEPRDVDLRP